MCDTKGGNIQTKVGISSVVAFFIFRRSNWKRLGVKYNSAKILVETFKKFVDGNESKR